VGKPEEKRPLGRPRRRWVNNIKMDLRDRGWGGMNWFDLTQDRDQWRTLMNTNRTFWLHNMLANSAVTAQLEASQEGLSCMELVILMKICFVSDNNIHRSFDVMQSMEKIKRECHCC
jgi:hypothetical protein